jgi:glycosyltransferase involved in cell wall biosynthesis
MSTLSLAMIVKNEGATIERVLNCAKLFVDEMIVVDTGSTDDTVAKARALGAKLHFFTWVEDFAAARNYSFSLCAMDWIIWLDGDDVISPENQKRILELKTTALSDEAQAMYLRYIYPPFRQWRERIVRRDLFVAKKIFWREPVHEFICGIDGDKVKYFDDIAITHDTPPDRHLLKKDRNISILRRHLQNGAAGDRDLFIYATECLHSLLADEAEGILHKFFSQVKIQEYRYEILCKMYGFYIHFAKVERAVEALSKAIAEDPTRAEAYYHLGRHVLNKDDQPSACIPLLTLASAIQPPGHGTPEMEAYTYGPWEALCRAQFRLERWEEAKLFAAKALAQNSPQAQWLEEMLRSGDGKAASLLPPQWQEWAEGNLGRQVPRWTVIRILEENGFCSTQIRGSLELFDQK